MLLYAITSRQLLPGGERERQAALVELARKWAHGGVDYIQVREKDLPLPDLLALSREVVTAVRSENSPTLASSSTDPPKPPSPLEPTESTCPATRPDALDAARAIYRRAESSQSSAAPAIRWARSVRRGMHR